MHLLPVITLAISLFSIDAESAWWSPFSKEPNARLQQGNQVHNALPSGEFRVPFEMGIVHVPGSDKGGKLLEDLRKLQSSCWVKGYVTIANSCRALLNDEEMKLRLAYHFADCFLRESGRPPLKPCPEMVSIKECTRPLNEHNTELLAKYFIDIGTMCHHLQGEAFQLETEKLVFDLKDSAHFVESRLTSMQVQSNTILENTGKIFSAQERLEEKVGSINEGVAGVQEEVNKQFELIKDFGEETTKHLHEMTDSQRDMTEKQKKMAFHQEVLATKLAEDISQLSKDFDVIDANVLKSLDNQQELFVRQQAVLSGLDSLKTISDDVLQLNRKLQDSTVRLIKGYESILEAQDTFSAKQGLIFGSLERLFKLHTSILVNLRTIKAFFFYAPALVLIYFLTGARQTNHARAILYLGLCICFGIEFLSLRFLGFSPLTEVYKNALLIRGTYSALGLFYILYCIFTYRDYSYMNYHILLDLQKKLDSNISFLGPLHYPTSTSEVQTDDSSEDSTGNCSDSSTCIRFKGYEDEYDQTREDDNSEDPDYDPEEDDDFEDRSVVAREYDLRRRVRRRNRPLAPSAAILDWETEEMFASLFRAVTPR